ncbi:sugar lactone lactonase YvrE [Edaphobacter aggregans]|uniref:Sugar lactone lactonase YvrE n=1 Tax=Edaphobacter aggregans TaxID=570835 RepID=A0A3R9QET9_9BACT|nr:Ig-like domain repeat protein [Edaphobacter aggregans]RSL14962.1 sugar lactone lactonase YvrE [Edaphobacter aggregans]
MGKQSGIKPYHPSRVLAIALLLLIALLPIPAPSQSSATTIPLILPTAIVFDPQGNLYLAETASHVIRKVDPNGIITTIAGTGTQGFSGDNGQATAAQLDSPQGLALDAANNIYIADTHNDCIRKITAATGIITTIAGTSTPGFSGDAGPATAAHLNLPTALAFDTTGNLYFADTQNHRIRKITATSGIITTIAGTGTQGFSGDNGPAIAATIDSPTGLAVDVTGNIYIADTHNHRIRRIDTTGTITTIAGSTSGFSGDNAPASAASLALPHGLTLDATGNIYIADTANHRIRRIDTTGTITTIAGEGTQIFAGDNGPAVNASLDSPRTATLTSTGLIALADTANQRIRQISTDKTIHTIAGLGVTIPGALTLTAPAVISYGTGYLTATLATSTPATGSITFLDTSTPSTLGTTPITSNSATLDTSTLSTGVHTIIATYAGDQTHASAQSTAISLTIKPQQLTASISPSTIFYGQPIPSLTATLTGLLPQDTGNLTVTFNTTATNLSPTGTYPLTPTLTGRAAGNYIFSNNPTLTIAPTPTLITLTASSATVSPGSPLTLTTHVASTTSGSPTGSIVLMDGTTTILTTTISTTGDATFTTSALSTGSHTLTIFYKGDGNFASSTSTPTIIGVGVAGGPTSSADFTVAATGNTTQTILYGASATFTFAIQPTGSTTLSSPITLAATGFPNLATASFNPTYLLPGLSTPNTVILTITTPKATTLNHTSAPQTTAFALLLLPVAAITLRLRNRHIKFLTICLLSLPLVLCLGCGARINTGVQSESATPSQTYTITVTGTATSSTGTILQHAATVTLVVQPSN